MLLVNNHISIYKKWTLKDHDMKYKQHRLIKLFHIAIVKKKQ